MAEKKKEVDVIKMLDDDLAFCHLEIDSKEELLLKLSDSLKDNGYVKEDFLEGIKKREEEFPTGINTENINVAIPHTDVEFVKKPVIAIATLKKPVSFFQMDKPDNLIDVEIVFVLAVKDQSKQVHLLTEMISVIQNYELLKDMKKCSTGEELVNLLKGYFKEAA